VAAIIPIYKNLSAVILSGFKKISGKKKAELSPAKKVP
jgi:hypothetical protein